MGLRETSIIRSATATLAAPVAIDDWRDRLRVATYALYRQLRESPALPIEREIQRLTDLIDEGRSEPASPPTLSRVTAEALGGAISHELFFAAHRNRPPESELIPMLMYSAVLPYTSAAAAAEELRIAPPPR